MQKKTLDPFECGSKSSVEAMFTLIVFLDTKQVLLQFEQKYSTQSAPAWLANVAS